MLQEQCVQEKPEAICGLETPESETNETIENTQVVRVPGNNWKAISDKDDSLVNPDDQ